MTDTIFLVLTVLAGLGTGVMAGTFFIFSNTAMRSLAQLPPENAIEAMQTFNRVILNPLFFLAFLGTGIISAVLGVGTLWRWAESGAGYVLAGSLVYLIGSILVTIVFNVPMNEKLDTYQADSAAGATYWATYLDRWTAWNHVRTVASVGALLLFILSLL